METEVTFDQLMRPSVAYRVVEKSNRIYFGVAGIYLFIFCALTILYFFPLSWSPISIGVALLCFISIGWAQFALSNAFHETIHFNFGKKHSELLGSLLTAYPIGMNMNYRRIHFNHHKYAGDRELDPDYSGYAPFPASRMDFVLRVLRYASGIPTVQQFLSQGRGAGSRDNRWDEVVKLAIVQIGIFVFFFLFFSSLHYFLFWLLPLATVAKLCSSFRLLCEHGSPDYGFTYRTITGNWLQTITLGSFKFHFHAEHHFSPSIPYDQLPAAHSHVRWSPGGSALRYEVFNGGYVQLLLKWFRSLP